MKTFKFILTLIIIAIVIGGLIALFKPTKLDDNTKDVSEYELNTN
jgi:hypothetical protein